MKIIVTLTAFLCSYSLAFAFDIVDLKALIENNKAYTVDSLLPLLPKQMRQNPLLVYDSHALRLDRVSPLTPRVILFNEDASLIMAFTKHPGEDTIASGDDSLEVIELNSQSHKFEMRDLVLNGKESPFSKSVETNPALCLSCHGVNPRPIFNDYNSWPGFYGSFSTRGYAVSGTTEFMALTEFLKNQSQLPRYRDLDLGGFVQDEIGYRTTSRGMGDIHDKNKFSISLAFGAKLESQMWRRLGAKLVTDDKFSAIAPLFYAMGEETNRCGAARDRVKAVRNMIVSNDKHPEWSTQLIDRIKEQIRVDHNIVSESLLKYNSVDGLIMDIRADNRGILNIPYTNYNTTPNEYAPVDSESFFALMMNMETIFRYLNYDSSDLSTTPGHPTSGIFHLKRLGRLLIDEQFFQNLIGGIYEASPTFQAKYDVMSCDQIYALAKKASDLISLPNPVAAGVLYK